MTRRPKAFVSYNHEDREVVTRIAEALREQGIDAWLDKWEILPGDSLVQKIFEEGLAGADAFIVFLSPASIDSRWVKQELDVAMVRRIEGITRVIPVRTGDVKLPESLRALKYLTLGDDVEATARDLQAAIVGLRERPPMGPAAGGAEAALSSVGGLSPLATRLGQFLSTTGNADLGNEEYFSASDISSRLGLTPEETDDAIDELQSLGLLVTQDYLGTHPFMHGEVAPTYALFLHFGEAGLSYDPENDIRLVASAVAAEKQATGPKLRDLTSLHPLRINRAIAYLDDYALAQTIQAMGCAPYNFSEVWATSATRKFVSEKCR